MLHVIYINVTLFSIISELLNNGVWAGQCNLVMKYTAHGCSNICELIIFWEENIYFLMQPNELPKIPSNR